MTTPSATCERCGDHVPFYDVVHYGNVEKSESLCMHCFNRAAAAQMGVEFEEARFESVLLTDCNGRAHSFQVRRRLCPSGQVIEAFELLDDERGGHQFAVLGDVAADPIEVFAQLYERMRRGLARMHVADGPYGPSLEATGPVRGRISSDYDVDPEPEPVIVIDGRTFTWAQFGRMLLSFEGWQFRLEIVDRTDEA